MATTIGSAHAQIKCTARQASRFCFAHKGAYPAPLAQNKRAWQPYGSTHAQILVHRTAGSPLLLCSKGSLPRPKSRNPLKQAVISVNE